MNNEEYVRTYFQGHGLTKGGWPLYLNHITGELYSCRDHRSKVKELGFSSLREYLLTKITEDINCPYCGELKAEEAKPSGGLRWTCGSKECKIKCRQDSASKVFKEMHKEIKSDPEKSKEFSDRMSRVAKQTWEDIKSDPERFEKVSKMQSEVSSELQKTRGPLMRTGWTINRLKAISDFATLYLVKLNEEYIKVGVTSNTVKGRFGNTEVEILFESLLTVEKAVEIETCILLKFPEITDKDISNLVKNGASEIRSISYLNEIMVILNESTTH